MKLNKFSSNVEKLSSLMFIKLNIQVKDAKYILLFFGKIRIAQANLETAIFNNYT